MGFETALLLQVPYLRSYPDGRMMPAMRPLMPPPTHDQRIAACRRPTKRQPVMYQKWRDLLFLHWEFDPEEIQQSLPRGLTVDTFDGKAYLGVVPFFMQDIRPRYLPAVPRISNFLEMNLRTYVYDKRGRPGVWFYSLDANQWLAVRVARTLFNLPYYDAVMQAHKQEEISYQVHRKGSSSEFDSTFRYVEREEVVLPHKESLEFFLIERYILFAKNRSGTLFAGQVSHNPYPLREVTVDVQFEGATALAGFQRPNRKPDHAIMSLGVDVDVYALEKVD